MKRELCGVMFLTWFSVLAMAQIAPTPTLKHGGQMAVGQKHFSHPGAPTSWENWCDYLGSGQTTECQGMSFALAGN